MKEEKVKSISLGVSKLINNSHDQFKNCSVSESLLFLTKALNSDFHNRNKKIKFLSYERGRIVKINFGLNIGAELSGPHYALVLTKNDNPISQKLTVIPFTSKNGKNHLRVHFNVSKELISYLAFNHVKYVSNVEETNFNIFIPFIAGQRFPVTHHPSYRNPKILLSSADKEKVFKKITNLTRKMKSINYLKLDNITTVSKFRIFKPSYELDPLKNLRVYPEDMEFIDKEISSYLLDQ